MTRNQASGDGEPGARPTSPRMQALRDSIAAGDDGAVPALWREIGAAGAPIVELADSQDGRLVTFVYRGEHDLENVVLTPGIGHNADPYFNQLERLGETDVWFRTYEVRRDLRTSYLFSPNDPMRMPLDMGVEESAAYMAERVPLWRTDPLNPHRLAIDPRAPAYSVIELPDAPPQPYLQPRDGVPEGSIEREDLGVDPFGQGRRIWTYLPPGYDPGRGPYPLVLQFDWETGNKTRSHVAGDIKGIGWKVACLGDGSVVCASGGSGGGFLLFWKPAEDKIFHQFNLPNTARDMGLHPNGLQVVTAHHDRHVRISELTPPPPPKPA